MRFPKTFVTSGRLAASRDLSAGDMRVLFALIALADDKSIATETQTSIAEYAGLSRPSVRESLARLIAIGYVESNARQGKAGSYCVLADSPLAWPELDRSGPIKNLSAQPAKWTTPANPELDRSGPIKTPPNLTGLDLSSPKGNLTRVLNSPTGGTHPHHPFAVKALTELRKDRRLPLQVTELLQHAYEAGVDGDPWDGYLRIKQATDNAITDARNPAAVLRARLRKLTEEEEEVA